jgi:transcriptional regulator with XRE-family HTH domain
MSKDPSLMQFGQRVRQFRSDLKISQEKLAELSELHRTYIGAIERGERNVSLINIVKLSRALKSTPSELLRGIE